MGTKYHVRIDGQGYLIREGSYRRFSGEPSAGKWRRWSQTDWRRGCGHRVGGEKGGWYRGEGIEISGEGSLSLGASLGARAPVNEQSCLAAMYPFGGDLYGVSGASCKVWCYVPSIWSPRWDIDFDAGSGVFLSLGSAFGEMMAGNGSGQVYSRDMGTWGLRYTLEADRRVTAIRGCGVWNSTDRTTVPRVAVGLSRSAGSVGAGVVKILTADEVVEYSLNCEDPVVVAMEEYKGKLYIATSWSGWGVGGRLLCFDANNGTREGVLREMVFFQDGSPECLAVSDGLLWVGLSNGRIVATDGVRVARAVDLVELGYSGAPVRSMVDFGGRLFGCFGQWSEELLLGACLISRLPSSVSGASPALGGTAEGWALSSYTGVYGDPRALAVHQGAVMMAVGEASPSSYRWDPSIVRAAGNAVTGSVDGGEPGAEKRYGRVLVEHSPLAVGQTVRALASVVGPEGPWIDLGESSVEGSTTGVLEFPAGSVGGLIWLRILLATGGSSGPEVRGVTLEYEVCGDGKRTWEMEVRCEGMPGLPLRLLDGTEEVMSGASLSETLWAAKGKGAVTFEDLDGVERAVRVASLTESLGRLVQEYGPQTVATIGLAEW